MRDKDYSVIDERKHCTMQPFDTALGGGGKEQQQTFERGPRSPGPPLEPPMLLCTVLCSLKHFVMSKVMFFPLLFSVHCSAAALDSGVLFDSFFAMRFLAKRHILQQKC